MIHPPGAKLIFTTEEVAEDEDFLAEYITEKDKISLEEAKQQILEFIDEIKFAFNKGADFKIEGVCSLSVDDNNNIKLVQDSDFIGDPESYGLESLPLKKEDEGKGKDAKEVGSEPEEEKEFYSEKIAWVLDENQDMHKFEETYVTGHFRKEEDTDIEKEKISTDEASQKEEIKIPQEPSPPPVFPSYPPEPAREMRARPGRRRLNIGLGIAGITILIVAALIFIPVQLDFFKDEINFDDIFGRSGEMEVNDDFSNIQDDDFNFDKMVEDLEQDIDSAARMENALDIPEEIAQEEKPSPVAEEEYVEYHVIAGSFRDYENAKELQQELTLQGYPSLIIEPVTGIYRVSAVSYRNKVTALNELVKFREKTGLSTAWLMNLE